MMYLKNIFVVLSAAILLSLSGCGTTSKGGGFNLFTADQDMKLGEEVEKQIESDPKQFPILKEQGNEEVYRYIRGIVNNILNSGKVQYRDKFDWETTIIDDDETLNAFCAPGGKIYVYTGIIKYLDSEDQLAGVLGHEIAHAALRHSTRQMTKIYGISALVSVVTGNADPGMLEQVAMGVISLSFSRKHETESDMHSVIYLCETDYNAAGAAGFFEKIEGNQTPPEFLSTHPNPGNRVESIKNKAKELGCKGSSTNKTQYDRIKRLLK